MAVISVIGTGGVGKSFLVKQLASATCSPAFFEGEEGTIPKEILDSVFNSNGPRPRWKFFVNRLKQNLLRAKKISDSGIDVYTDDSSLSPHAIVAWEDVKYHEELHKISDELSNLKSDITILLVTSKEKIWNFVRQRCRCSEIDDKAVERAVIIQNEFLKLADDEKNIAVIDRNEMDFSKAEDLNNILKLIQKLKEN